MVAEAAGPEGSSTEGGSGGGDSRAGGGGEQRRELQSCLPVEDVREGEVGQEDVALACSGKGRGKEATPGLLSLFRGSTVHRHDVVGGNGA